MRLWKVLAGQSWRTNPLGPLTQPATIRRWEEGGNFIIIVVIVIITIIIIIIIIVVIVIIIIEADGFGYMSLMIMTLLRTLMKMMTMIRCFLLDDDCEGRSEAVMPRSSHRARPRTISYQNWVGGGSTWELITFAGFPQFQAWLLFHLWPLATWRNVANSLYIIRCLPYP